MGVLDIEPSRCDGMLKGVNTGDDEFLNMIDILDFPMESVDDDDLGGAGWDENKLQSLGPIPTEALVSFPPVPEGYSGSAFSNALSRHHNSLSVGHAKPKQLPNYGKQFKSNIHHENAPSQPQESGVFQKQSSVSVLETGRFCPTGKSLLTKPDIIIPVRPRSKRARATVFNPWFGMTPVTSATCAYKKAAGYKKPSWRKDKVSEAPLSSTSGLTDESFKEGKEVVHHASYVAGDYKASLEQFIPMKACSHCQVTKTPQWREGPMGPKTLCNACGVRYGSGRLYPEYRPVASPTFVPTLHSNSHRKVVEMRKKGGTVQDSHMTPPMESKPRHRNSQRKVLGTRKKATVQENDLMHPKRRNVMGTMKEGHEQENNIMQEKSFMHNTLILSIDDPTLDPNVSTKFMGMKMKAIKQEIDSIPDAPMSPAPEFVPMNSYLFDLIY